MINQAFYGLPIGAFLGLKHRFYKFYTCDVV